MTFIAIICAIACGYFAYQYLALNKRLKPQEDLSKLMDELQRKKAEAESDIEKLKSEVMALKPGLEIKDALGALQADKNELEKNKEQLIRDIDSFKKQLAHFSDEIDLRQSGVVKLEYDFGTSEAFAEKLEEIRSRQKELVKNKDAIKCDKEWTVGGSKAEGKKMMDRLIKLGLNAFNYQCDNIILNVKYNNYDKSKEKIIKLQETIEKLLEVNECYVNKEYIKLKFQELDLAFGYQEKLYEEKEEQKRIRAQMQEEEKVRKEIEKAKLDAEKEEQYYEKALDKARKELEKKQGEEFEQLQAKIRDMEQQLQEAHEKKERALSMAEQTKRGHVYIISNIGSFGENVLKIGMTRRLDPMERIYELGDASVPFEFDVHAMIFSEDAPDLEKKLHSHFTEKRTNQVNIRKEFFNISISEIEKVCSEMKLKVELTKAAEAREYYQTLEKLKEIDKKAA
jgi:hypothetical protein